ncbi:putative glycosyl hydrolase 3 family protein [Lyophyllum shimeji]|uniref:beta-glucosidase n=1 Tax=Lyophyllum shimeji TaxID=47721 RepID=A0A9P3PDV1_LYOSH|nr:putative glycosyl hydrolase 3 family protein [Lyophyllum shimeji]
MRQLDGDRAIAEALKAAKDADAAILVVGLNHDYESEGFDRPDIELPGLTNQLVWEVLVANPNTVVVNQSGTPVSMPWVEQASTVLQAFYGGNELGNGLADVLFGKVNPSGKLPLTFPKRLEDSPSYPSFGDRGQEYGKILYNEGIFVGYRGFEIKKLAPLFPFGFGLSYTQFEYTSLDASIISPAGDFTISFDVKNTGQVHGREVAQIYITDQQSSLPRPIKELKGFVKADLKPGETKRIEHALDRESIGIL